MPGSRDASCFTPSPGSKVSSYFIQVLSRCCYPGVVYPGVGLSRCWVIQVLGYPGVGLSRCWVIQVLLSRGWVIQVLGYPGVGLSRCWVIQVLGYPGVGLSRCWVIQVLGYPGVGLSRCWVIQVLLSRCCYPGVVLSRCWVIQVLGYPGVGLSRCCYPGVVIQVLLSRGWVIQVLGYPGVGLSRCWVIQVLGYPGVGLSRCCTTKQVQHPQDILSLAGFTKAKSTLAWVFFLNVAFSMGFSLSSTRKQCYWSLKIKILKSPTICSPYSVLTCSQSDDMTSIFTWQLLFYTLSMRQKRTNNGGLPVCLRVGSTVKLNDMLTSQPSVTCYPCVVLCYPGVVLPRCCVVLSR